MASFPYRPVAPATGLSDAFTERAAEPATAHSHRSTGPKERPRTRPCSSERIRPTRSVRSPTAVKSILMTHRGGILRQAHEGPEQCVISAPPPGLAAQRAPGPVTSADTVPPGLGTAAPQAALISGLALRTPVGGRRHGHDRRPARRCPGTVHRDRGLATTAIAPPASRPAPSLTPHSGHPDACRRGNGTGRDGSRGRPPHGGGRAGVARIPMIGARNCRWWCRRGRRNLGPTPCGPV